MVYNLGIKIAITEMIDKALEVNADAIGMSGLLVKSTIIMRENLEELNTRGLADRVAGAARRRRAHAQLRGARSARGLRRPRLLRQGRVRRSAHDGNAMAGKKSGDLDPAFGREAGGRQLPPRKSQLDAAAPPVEIPDRSDVATDAHIFTPPFVGSRVAKGISLDDIAGYINETALFRNQWQFRPEKGGVENDEEFKARIRPTLRDQLGIAKQESLLVPAAAWGYFAVNAEGTDLVVWKDDTRTQEWMRFSFRASARRRSSASPTSSGRRSRASRLRRVPRGHDGFTRERARAGAVRRRPVPGVPAAARAVGRDDRGARRAVAPPHPRGVGLRRRGRPVDRRPVPSAVPRVAVLVGLPACPDLDDQVKVAELLEIDRIGVAITEEFHLVPEQSTSAIVVPHPEAKYFVA